MGWLPGWTKRIKWTIDQYDIDTAVTWFPVRLHVSAASGTATLIEEQASSTAYDMLYNGGPTRIGQKLTISSRTVTRLAFRLHENGSAGGDVTFTIRQLDDTVLASKVWGDGESLTSGSGGAWYEVILDTPVLINEEVRICCEFSGGSGIFHGVAVHRTTDKKASELWTQYDGSWTDYSPYDCTYRYTYTAGSTYDISAVFDEVGANSKRIALTKADGTTELYGEIEKWDNGAEEAEIWVSRDGWAIADDADTDGYLYYDNSHADSDEGGTAGNRVGDTNTTAAEGVWDGSFKGVWHMADGADTSNIYDSTSNDNDGAKHDANEPIVKAGQIANAQEFDGTDDDINVGQDSSLDLDEMTISTLIYSTDTANFRTFVGSYTDSENWFQYRIDNSVSDGRIACYGRDSNTLFRAYTTSSISEDAWYSISTTATSGGVVPKIYINGVDQAISEANDANGDVTHRILHGDIYIGEGYNSSRYYKGKICDVLISSVVRPDEWIKAIHQNNIDGLVTWGAEEVVAGELLQTWASYQQISPLGVNLYRAGRSK